MLSFSRHTIPGHRIAVQCAQGGAAAAARPGRTEAGSISRVRCGHADTVAVLLHAGRSLAGLHLVLDRAERCRQRGKADVTGYTGTWWHGKQLTHHPALQLE